MTFCNQRRRHLITGIAAAAAFGLMLPAYGAGDSTSVTGNSVHNQPLTKLNIAIVPVLDGAPYLYAKARGYYKDAGLDVTISANDSGPTIITSVINGTYDAGATAWFPAAIAISKGAKLKYVMTPAYMKKGAGHGDSGVVVKPDSGITSYKDLEGKTVATNALTSLVTLVTKVVVKDAGGDPEKVKFVALPFKTGVQAVAQGQVDAAVAVSPFQMEAQKAGLKIFGDPIVDGQPQGSPAMPLFTSAANAVKKAKAFAAFTKATHRAAQELEENEKLRRKVAHDDIGLPTDIAQKVPFTHYTTQPINLKALQEDFDLAYEYGYLGHPIKAKDAVVAQ